MAVCCGEIFLQKREKPSGHVKTRYVQNRFPASRQLRWALVALGVWMSFTAKKVLSAGLIFSKKRISKALQRL